MEATPKTDFLRKSRNSGSNVRCALLHVSAGEKERAYTRGRVKTPVQRFFHRGQKRAQAGEDAPSWGCMAAKRRKEIETDQHPAGAQAPENTTQYIMSNAYGDLKAESIQLKEDPTLTGTDSELESFLNFLQRDFDEAVADLTW